MARIAIALAVMLMTVTPLWAADDVPQMPRDLPQSSPQAQSVPQTMPQAVPQRIPGQVANGDYMLDCRTSWMTLVFLIHPESGLVEVVSSFPQWQGTLFESDSEYVIAFNKPRALEIVISRYTGRMTVVEDGLSILATGMCRKRAAKTLF